MATKTLWHFYTTRGLGSDGTKLIHIEKHPITTLHTTARSKVETTLLDVTLALSEVSQFTPTPETNKDDDKATKYDNNTKNRGSIRVMLIV